VETGDVVAGINDNGVLYDLVNVELCALRKSFG
jgi:hypothetical protein